MALRLFDPGRPRFDARKLARKRRNQRALRAEQTCEQLEGRVVLSNFGGGYGGMEALAHGRGLRGSGGFGGGAEIGGFAASRGIAGPIGAFGGAGEGSLSGSLAAIGVTGPGGDGLQGAMINTPPASSSSTGTQFAQLQTDLQKLQTDLKAISATSGVTVADLNNLATDQQAFAQAGVHLDQTALQSAVNQLATAVAAGASTAQAQTAFTALFTGTSVTSATITKAFTDLTQSITDSKVTSAQISTITADQAAVQSDQTILQASSPMGLPGGGALVQNLTSLGVLPGGGNGLGGGSFGSMRNHRGWGGSSSSSTSSTSTAMTQLQTDSQKLQTDLQTVASASGVTVADTTNLKADAVAIAQAGATLDPTALKSAVSELVTAVASGASTSQAQTDFTALFSGTKVTSATITKALTDLTQTITDSKITPTELTTIAADQAAVQADLTNLKTTAPTTTASTSATTSSASSTSSTSITTTATPTTTTTTASATGAHHRERRAGRHGRR